MNNKYANRINYLQNKYSKSWIPYEPCNRDRSRNSMRKNRLEMYNEFIDEFSDLLSMDAYSKENLKYYINKYSLSEFHGNADYKTIIVALSVIFLRINNPRKSINFSSNKVLKKYGVSEDIIFTVCFNFIKLLMNNSSVTPKSTEHYDSNILNKMSFDYLLTDYTENEDLWN